MLIPMLLAKIHRATVTAADLHYEGSISIDRRLLQAAGLMPHQQVQIYDIANGNRFETYVMEAEAGSGTIQINGAAAHLAHVGDLIIVAAYGLVPADAAAALVPRIVLVDAANRPVEAPARTDDRPEPVDC